MKLIETELARIVKPFDVDVIWRALDGKETVFDKDAVWSAHSHGRPRTFPRGQVAFDGDAFLAGVQAIAFLAANLGASDPRRLALEKLDRTITKRLTNPELLLFGACDADRFNVVGKPYERPDENVCGQNQGVDNGALLSSGSYLYFRPAFLRDPADIALGALATELIWTKVTFGFSGLFGVLEAYRSPSFRRLVTRTTSTPLRTGEYETNPLHSAPMLVADVEKELRVSTSAAALYLQLLSLCDASDTFLRSVNGTTATQHKKAIAELAELGLAKTEKRPRANRVASLHGNWERLKSPQPAIESWKLPFYDARMEGADLWAPLGRLLPVYPVNETFARAWNEVLEKGAPRATAAKSESTQEWVAQIAAAPGDDALRRVYADYLLEQGDQRGALINLQLRRRELARVGPSEEVDQVCLAEEAILAAHGQTWIEKVYPHVDSVRWEGGFVHSITIHGKTFSKNAELLFNELPLLREVTLLSTRRNHIDAFVNCPSFEKIRQLDFTANEYLRNKNDLSALLRGKHFPKLEWLRIGFHRSNSGFGPRGAELIAACERLRSLRFLEVAGQHMRLQGAKALLTSENLENLEVLRLPLNGITDRLGKKLLALIEKGVLPRLRVFDVGNVVETDFVPAAVNWRRNRVSSNVQRAIVRTLGERGGGESVYQGEPIRTEPVSNTSIVQSDGFPFAEIAKSSRSACIICETKIAKGELRIGVEGEHDDARRITRWLHSDCRGEWAGTQSLDDLDERLKRNSSGRWPPS